MARAIDGPIRTGVIVAIDEAMARMGYRFASASQSVPAAGEAVLCFRRESDGASVEITVRMEER